MSWGKFPLEFFPWPTFWVGYGQSLGQGLAWGATTINEARPSFSTSQIGHHLLRGPGKDAPFGAKISLPQN